MHISRIEIENFRNFHHLDLYLGPQAVIVGENKVGKSNLIHALRLVLDPTLPNSARQLRFEDFWDGIPRPIQTKTEILVGVEISDFDVSDVTRAALGDLLVETDPPVARVNYVFKAKDPDDSTTTSESDFDWTIYPRNDPTGTMQGNIQRAIPLDVLHALRDAEADLANWKHSPLRPLLARAESAIDQKKLASIAQEIANITATITKMKEIKELKTSIQSTLDHILGSLHSFDTSLGFVPIQGSRLLRSLQILVDQGTRGIRDMSLGAANLLYLTLHALDLEQLASANERQHTFLCIEEPEAHLHPHLQRLVFREFLQDRTASQQEKAINHEQLSTLLTSHSPQIVSVAPVRSIALLRQAGAEPATIGSSTVRASLTDSDVSDLGRYLDVTRGEIVFGKGVLLVEGDAERFLVPILSALNEFDMDRLGIAVCSVAGTNFRPYLKFLGANGLNIPFAVLTDMDPTKSGNASGLWYGRIRRLLKFAIGLDDSDVPTDEDELMALGAQFGLFVNEHGFEVDLFACGQHKVMCKSLETLTTNQEARNRATDWSEAPSSLDKVQFLKDIEAIGKGRFAQHVSARLKKPDCPPYILSALEHLRSLIEG